MADGQAGGPASEKDVRTSRPVLASLAVPVLVRVAIHQLTSNRVAFFLEPLGTVHCVRMIYTHPVATRVTVNDTCYSYKLVQFIISQNEFVRCESQKVLRKLQKPSKILLLHRSD